MLYGVVIPNYGNSARRRSYGRSQLRGAGILLHRDRGDGRVGVVLRGRDVLLRKLPDRIAGDRDRDAEHGLFFLWLDGLGKRELHGHFESRDRRDERRSDRDRQLPAAT
jgi:hypothetical protein